MPVLLVTDHGSKMLCNDWIAYESPSPVAIEIETTVISFREGLYDLFLNISFREFMNLISESGKIIDVRHLQNGDAVHVS